MGSTTQSYAVNLDTTPQNIHEYLAGDLKTVEDIICQVEDHSPNLMGVMMHHVMAAGGKRTRPLLTLATANLFGDITPTTHSLAASVELIHTATLLHDDVMDDADMRRHSQTAHTRFGNVMSILFGDFLLAKSFQHMLIMDDPRVMHVLAKTCAAMARGEIRQLTTRHHWQLNQSTYEQTIREKTASLFSAACELGGLSQKVSETSLSQLHQMGEHIGMAFQIIDDVMDYAYENSGKNPGSDFFDGKITLPIILAVKSGVDTEFWRTVLTQEERDQTDFSTAVAYLKNHNILSECHKAAADHLNKALDILNALPSQQHVKLHLQDFIFSLGERQQ